MQLLECIECGWRYRTKKCGSTDPRPNFRNQNVADIVRFVSMNNEYYRLKSDTPKIYSSEANTK